MFIAPESGKTFNKKYLKNGGKIVIQQANLGGQSKEPVLM